jgi:hypothetical protein
MGGMGGEDGGLELNVYVHGVCYYLINYESRYSTLTESPNVNAFDTKLIASANVFG